jgi:hypothetical protein
MACNDAELVARVGEKARATALREYGWEPLVKRFIEFYGKVSPA